MVTVSRMAEAPSPRSRATELIGRPVETWIDEHRQSAAKLSYGQIARVLLADYGVDVQPETVRAWHALAAATTREGDTDG